MKIQLSNNESYNVDFVEQGYSNTKNGVSNTLSFKLLVSDTVQIEDVIDDIFNQTNTSVLKIINEDDETVQTFENRCGDVFATKRYTDNSIDFTVQINLI